MFSWSKQKSVEAHANEAQWFDEGLRKLEAIPAADDNSAPFPSQRPIKTAAPPASSVMGQDR
jgi:hypothetical protein